MIDNTYISTREKGTRRNYAKLHLLSCSLFISFVFAANQDVYQMTYEFLKVAKHVHIHVERHKPNTFPLLTVTCLGVYSAL